MSSTANRKSPDQTFPFTGHGGNNSTYERKSISRSNSTCSNFSIDPNLSISSQLLMPTLLTLKQQNQHLTHQKQLTSKDLTSLQSLTQHLLSQNQALRLHFHQRSSDIKQLIQSLTINTNQDISDSKHLVHSYRQHNCIIAKQIHQYQDKIDHVDVVLDKMCQRYCQIGHANTKMEEILRNVQVKNQILGKNIKVLEKKKKESGVEQLEREICQLQVSNNVMKKKNISTLKYIRQEKHTISNQKPDVKQKAIQAIKSVKMLQRQIQVMNHDLTQFREEKNLLAIKEQSTREQAKQSYISVQSQLTKLDRLIQKRKNTEEQIQQTKKTTKTLQTTTKSLQQQKLQLQHQLKQRKQNLSTCQSQHNKQKQKILQQSSQKVSQIHEQLNKTRTNIHKTLYQQYNPQQKQYDSTIVFYRNQLVSLDKDIDGLREKIRSTPDCLKDIMRVQMEIKIRGKNRGK